MTDAHWNDTDRCNDCDKPIRPSDGGLCNKCHAKFMATVRREENK